MNTAYIHIPKTLSAQLQTAYHPPRCLWHPAERIETIARYYRQRRLRLHWCAQRRSLVAEIL